MREILIMKTKIIIIILLVIMIISLIWLSWYLIGYGIAAFWNDFDRLYY